VPSRFVQGAPVMKIPASDVKADVAPKLRNPRKNMVL
jgi:hypothetical protein